MPTPINKHPVTGCRADTMFDVWLHPLQQLQPLVNAAWGVVEAGDLQRCSNESKAMDEENKQSSYIVDGNIAKVSLSGPMTKYPTSFQSIFGGTSTLRVREAIREISQNETIKAVFVDADSWGGTSEGMTELVDAFRQLDKIKPVFFHAEDKATSACLWPAAVARRFTCGPSACVGSQGTMTMLYDTSEAQSKTATKPLVFSTGELKAIGAPGLPITEKHKVEIQRRIEGINEPFKQDVIQGRKLNVKQAEEVATARVFVGVDALRVGLVDAVCSTNEAYNYLKQCLVSGVVSRSPAPAVKLPAAPKRSVAMPLSAEQLTKARTLPGAANLSEENADVMLFTVADQLAGQLKVQRETATAATVQIGELQQEIVNLKKLVPAKMEPSLAKGKADLAIQRVDLMAEKGLVLPTQVAKLKTAFMNGEVPNEVMLSDAVQGVVFDILKDNKPNGLMTNISGGQPAPKHVPGGTDDKTPTYARANELRMEAQLPLLTPEQYKQKYGVDAVR